MLPEQTKVHPEISNFLSSEEVLESMYVSDIEIQGLRRNT